MTTIAYRDGVLAADTLATWGDSRDGRISKIVKRGPILACAGGAVAGGQRFLDWVRTGMQGDPPESTTGDGEWYGYIITPDDQFCLWGPRGWERCRGETLTLGSGSEYAKGAMSMGADAVRAVEVAILHDTKSGGPIEVLRR
ncbi:hypothetical protein [Brevundimonas sp.]|uniref:hypothetical protein n=1 Tax=Brevundimonas sp. TaxID=1871086 RepID=UPI0035B249AE